MINKSPYYSYSNESFKVYFCMAHFVEFKLIKLTIRKKNNFIFIPRKPVKQGLGFQRTMKGRNPHHTF